MKKSVLFALVLALSLAACSGDGDDEQRDVSRGESAPALQATWETEWMQGLSPDTAFAAGGHLVLSTRRSVVGIDPETGETAWERRLPTICAVSRPSPDSGLVAVAWSPRSDDACARIAVLDPEQGTWRWRARLPGMVDANQQAPDRSPLSVGDSTITALTDVDHATVALRFDLRSGRSLETVDPDTAGFGGSVATDGQTIATFTSLNMKQDRTLLRAYDADSGKLLWTRRTSGPGPEAEVAQVLASSPLILQTAERGRAMLRTLDRATGSPLGEPVSVGRVRGGYDVQLATRADEALVVTPPLTAHDLGSGEKLWSTDVWDDNFCGVDASGRLLVSSQRDGVATLTRHSAEDFSDREVLGTISDEDHDRVFSTVLGDTLLVAAQDDATMLAAYELPETMD